MILVNSLIYFDSKARHQFFFLNHRVNKNCETKLLSFENLCSVMFVNRDKLSQANSLEQKLAYNEIKISFIEMFSLYSHELSYMENYIKSFTKTYSKAKP